jgi:hypothetical protein
MGKMRQNTRRNPLADKDLKNLEKSENGPKKAGTAVVPSTFLAMEQRTAWDITCKRVLDWRDH